jgi:hypothetical protein
LIELFRISHSHSRSRGVAAPANLRGRAERCPPIL